MAATPSKPSPSNKDAGGGESSTATASAAVQAPTEASSASSSSLLNKKKRTLKDPPPSSLPTYASSEASRHYTTAKFLMKEGDFETALTTIEEAIAVVQSSLGSIGSTDDDDNCLLHESMAPFYYLYGTTLLYSIEESQDATQQMTYDTTVSSPHQEQQQPEQQQQGDEAEEEQEVTDETQIAWENLETARTILEQLLQTPASSSSEPRPDSDKLKADLAQVYLREGDLLRHDSRYDSSIECYQKTLELLLSSCCTSNSPLAASKKMKKKTRFDRRIADVHYNLALVYFLQVAAETNVPPAREGDDGNTNKSDGANTAQAAAELKQKLAAARLHGLNHYWECSKQLAGLMVALCSRTTNGDNDDAAAEELLAQAEQQVSRLKTTGQEEDDEEEADGAAAAAAAASKIISHKLSTLRALVSKQLKPQPEEQHVFSDFMDLLDEIQETIDEQENSFSGVQQVTAMKEQITAAVAAQVDNNNNNNNNEASSVPAFGSAAAAASTATAQTMMVVKKKKKKDKTDSDNHVNHQKRKETDDDEGEDVKLPAIQEPSAKRPKSE